MGKLIDHTGQRFGRLTVVSQDETFDHGRARWKCKCDCGSEVVVSGFKLRSKHTQSCGCLQRERAHEANVTHGKSHSKMFGIWWAMHQRCNNEKTKSYKWYGARGIAVCDRWRKFENFLEDVGSAPPNCSIDRVDNALGYSPDNWKWSTCTEQNRNRRSNKMILFNGETKPLAEWVEDLSLNYGRVQQRLYNGWSVEDAFSIPNRERRRK